MSKKLFQIEERTAIADCGVTTRYPRGCFADLPSDTFTPPDPAVYYPHRIDPDLLDENGQPKRRDISGGFKRGELALIAAPNISGQKKTLFVDELAREASPDALRVMLEEDPERLKERLILMHPANHGKSQSLGQLLAGLRQMDPVAMQELTNMHRRGGKASRVAEQITDVVLKDMLQPMAPEEAERKPESTGMVQEIHPPETVIPFEERLEMAVEHWNLRALKVPPKIRTQMTSAEIDQWVAECTELMDANGVPRRYGQLFEAMMNRSHQQKHFHAAELVDKDIFGLIRRVSKVSKSKRKRK